MIARLRNGMIVKGSPVDIERLSSVLSACESGPITEIIDSGPPQPQESDVAGGAWSKPGEPIQLKLRVAQSRAYDTGESIAAAVDAYEEADIAEQVKALAANKT